MLSNHLKLHVASLLLLLCVSVKAQERSITGKVLSASERTPLSNVTVRLKDSKSGVQTDEKGYFSITVPNINSVLVVSCVGYQQQEIKVGSSNSLQILLLNDENKLDDVVVIGYGTVKKGDLTGAVSSVKSEELNQYPTGNALQALNGRAAGVRVIQNDATPGAQPSIRIRGTTSVIGSSEPLYVVDGFPDADINGVQTSDIESIEILKDASATAIYGSRGANGVVIITTKNGKVGKTLVEYSGSYGIQSPIKLLNLMNNVQWAQFYNQQASNDGLASYFSESQIDEIARTPSFDWQKSVISNAPIQAHYVNVSGGSDKTTFSISGNLFSQNGIIRENRYNRYSLGANLSHKINKIFTVAFRSSLSRTINDAKPMGLGSNRGGGLLSAIAVASPAISPYDEEGSLQLINIQYPWLSSALDNPLYTIYERSNLTATNRELINLAFSVAPIDGLMVRISGGIQNIDARTDSFNGVNVGLFKPGEASINTTQSPNLLTENTATYTKKIADHGFTALAGFTYQQNKHTSLYGSGIGFLNNLLETADLQSADSPGIPTSSYTASVLVSYLARFNYNYKGKYLATLSYRRDGSSKFSVLHKWSNFPSGALSWVVSKENFMRSINFISNLKLRASWGTSGNNAVSSYQTLNMLSSSKVVFGNELYTAFGPGSIKPGPLKWETTNEYNAGIDFGFLNNRINLTVDAYHKKTTDLLNIISLPTPTGYRSTLQNIGAIQNRGFELDVQAKIIDRKVKWSANSNISFNKNKVLKLAGGSDLYGTSFQTGILNGIINLIREGQPLGIMYGYLEDGYTSTGDIQYKDLNDDGIINGNDRSYIGNPYPKFNYGFGSDVSYKGLSLSLFLQGSQGNDIFNLNATQTVDFGFGLNQPVDLINNHWTIDNPNKKYPKISKNISAKISERYVEDGSYLRLKNVQVGYDIPFSKNVKWITNIQVYASAQNLLTFTKYSWYDPEVSSYGGGNSVNIGIDSYGYPAYKTVTFGVKSKF